MWQSSEEDLFKDDFGEYGDYGDFDYEDDEEQEKAIKTKIDRKVLFNKLESKH